MLSYETFNYCLKISICIIIVIFFFRILRYTYEINVRVDLSLKIYCTLLFFVCLFVCLEAVTKSVSFSQNKVRSWHYSKKEFATPREQMPSMFWSRQHFELFNHLNLT